MERGAVPWVRPWKTERRGVVSVMPGNASTGRSYSGINIPILWASADMNGYPTHAWMTFKQALDHGANVRKGERGTHVVFTKPVVFKGEDDEIEKRCSASTPFSTSPKLRASGAGARPWKPSSPRRAPISGKAETKPALSRHWTSSICRRQVLSEGARGVGLRLTKKADHRNRPVK